MPAPSCRSPATVNHGPNCGYSSTRINQKQVHPIASGLLPHVFDKAYKVSPICTIVMFFKMSFEPAMCICCMNEVQLAPGKRSFGIGGSIQCNRLHTSDEPSMDVRIGWAIA